MTIEKNKMYLSHVMDSIDRIETSSANVSKDDFMSNYDLQDATLRRFEVIGEAANNLSADFKDKHKEIVWREIIDMRNRVIHGYFDVDLETVWNAIKNDIPLLKSQIKTIQRDLM